jgi:hypothetical protein
MKCPECGNENPPDDRYCGKCGRRLVTPGSAEIPDWLLHDRPVGDSRVGRRSSGQEISTPYYTVSWNLSQARKLAVMTTIFVIPAIMFMVYLAVIIDNLYASVFIIICCVPPILGVAWNWMRVNSIERNASGVGKDEKGV